MAIHKAGMVFAFMPWLLVGKAGWHTGILYPDSRRVRWDQVSWESDLEGGWDQEGLSQGVVIKAQTSGGD